MRLLLLRAAEDAARTRLTLEAAGHAVLVSPVLVFESTEESWPRRAPDGLIATSSRAFNATEATRADLMLSRDEAETSRTQLRIGGRS